MSRIYNPTAMYKYAPMQKAGGAGKAGAGAVNLLEGIEAADQTWTIGTVVSNGSAVVCTQLGATSNYWLECPALKTANSYTFSCTVSGFGDGVAISVLAEGIASNDVISGDGFFTTTWDSGGIAGTGFGLSGLLTPDATLTDLVLIDNEV